MMLNKLAELVAPAEIKWVTEEIRGFFSAADYMAGEVCEKEAIRIIKNKEKTLYSIRVDKMHPKELALLVISNVAYKLVASGQHHIYRGVLSMHGKEYLRIFCDAVNEAASNGFIPHEEAEDDIKELGQLVREAG